MEEKAIAYFSSVNPLARKIIKDEEVLKTALGDEWFNLDWQKREELIDDFIVDETVRQHYADVPKLHDYPPSFPKLYIESGEKINVDFEDDSQQDLTLADLEPDVLSKPVSKGKKKASEPPVQEAPRVFSVQSGTSIWQSPFLQGMKKPEYVERSRSTSTDKSAATSKESLASREQSPEAVNYAFTESIDDLTSTTSTMDTERSSSVSSREILDVSPTHGNSKPKAPKRRKSLTKSPKKISSKKSDTDGGFISLVNKTDEEDHAFDNPIVDDAKWSTFSNDTQDALNNSYSSSIASSPSHRLLKEPEAFQMDRGEIADVEYRSENHRDTEDKCFDGFGSDFQDATLVVDERDDAPNTLNYRPIAFNSFTPRDLCRGPSLHKQFRSRYKPSHQDLHYLQNASVVTKSGFDFLDDW